MYIISLHKQVIAISKSEKKAKKMLYKIYADKISKSKEEKYIENYIDPIEHWWDNIGQFNFTIQKLSYWR